jgi:vacuolar-type H+-ATPase catalytic subunit A/Vma1
MPGEEGYLAYLLAGWLSLQRAGRGLPGNEGRAARDLGAVSPPGGDFQSR